MDAPILPASKPEPSVNDTHRPPRSVATYFRIMVHPIPTAAATPSPGVSSGRPSAWLVVCVAWAVPALADVFDVYFWARGHGTPLSFSRVFAVEFPGWYIWVPLTPAIVALDWWARSGSRPVLSAAVTHLFGAACGTLVHTAVLFASARLFDPAGKIVDHGASYLATLVDHVPVSLTHYAVVLGAWYAWRGFHAHREERVRIAELEARLARAELLALRAQLHPHFLFNTMNAAVSRLRTGDAQGAADVLMDLSELLRVFLAGASAPEVTLGDELSLVSRYLAIERARFPARLLTKVDVPDELRHAKVPTLVLQPLVENAVRHAVGRQEAPVRVQLDARLDDGVLRLRVADDGPGLPPGWSLERDAGVGLRNTRERLDRIYGAKAQIRVATLPTHGVEAIVSLPFNA